MQERFKLNEFTFFKRFINFTQLCFNKPIRIEIWSWRVQKITFGTSFSQFWNWKFINFQVSLCSSFHQLRLRAFKLKIEYRNIFFLLVYWFLERTSRLKNKFRHKSQHMELFDLIHKTLFIIFQIRVWKVQKFILKCKNRSIFEESNLWHLFQET